MLRWVLGGVGVAYALRVQTEEKYAQRNLNEDEEAKPYGKAFLQRKTTVHHEVYQREYKVHCHTHSVFVNSMISCVSTKCVARNWQGGVLTGREFGAYSIRPVKAIWIPVVR